MKSTVFLCILNNNCTIIFQKFTETWKSMGKIHTAFGNILSIYTGLFDHKVYSLDFVWLHCQLQVRIANPLLLFKCRTGFKMGITFKTF